MPPLAAIAAADFNSHAAADIAAFDAAAMLLRHAVCELLRYAAIMAARLLRLLMLLSADTRRFIRRFIEYIAAYQMRLPLRGTLSCAMPASLADGATRGAARCLATRLPLYMIRQRLTL